MMAQQDNEQLRSLIKEDKEEGKMGQLHAALLASNAGCDLLSRKELGIRATSPDVQGHLDKLDWTPKMLTDMSILMDSNSSGQVSLAKLREEIQNFKRPLDTTLIMRLQCQLAARLEHQERLCLTVLDVLSQVTGKKFRFSSEAGDTSQSYLTS